MGLEGFVGARSIAVVGASERNPIARIALDNLVRLGFPGPVVGIHPSGKPVDGVPTVPSLQDAPDRVDLALLAIGARRLPEAIRSAAEAGVTALVVPGAGANEGGREVEAELRAAVEDAGVEVMGPNCMGLASLHRRVVPYVGTLDPDLQPGSVGLVSQSGSVCELFTALPWRIGLSHVVSVGNELGLDLTSALEYLVEDPATRAIGLFIEGVRRPEAFRSALERAAAAGKPVVAVKVGRSDVGRAGTVAHTGALAGDDRVFSAVLRDAGAIEARDLDELFVTLELLGKGLERPPGRVIYAGDSGGQANLFADLAADHGVELPRLGDATVRALRGRFPSLGDEANPLDLWALDEPEDIYRHGVPILLEHEPHLVVLGLDKFLARTEPERAFVRAGVEAVGEPGAVVLMAHAGSDSADPEVLRACWERRIPVVRGAGTILSALAALERWSRWRTEGEPARRHSDLEEARATAAGTEDWTEWAALSLVARAGIPVPRAAEVATAEDGVAFAVETGFPVVVKAGGARFGHKSELGGVRLDLWTEDDVRRAVEDVLGMAPMAIVARQHRTDVELIAAGLVDEQFGPCALLGMGGTWTEAFGEATVVVGPGSTAAVRWALEGHAWGRLLMEGARGRTFPVDRVIDVTLRLIDLVRACSDRIRVVEINPLLVDGDQVVAVDALVDPR